MERSRNHSRFVRLTAVLLFSALLFGTIAGSASAMRVTINGPVKVGVMTPVTGVIVNPPVTPEPTVIDPEPTGVLVDEAPAETPEPTDVAVVDTTNTSNVTDSSSANPNPYNFAYFDLFLCPKGYNAPSDANQALSDCANRASNVPMHLINEDGDHLQTASTSVSWEYLRPGPITVKQDVTSFQKAPFLFCRSTNGVFVPETVTDGAWNTSIAPNQEIYCAWFITPKTRPTDGIVATTTGTFSQGDGTVSTADPGSLLINGASTCPVGFDVAAATIYELAANCHDAGPIADYHVTAGQGTEDVLQTTLASFNSVPSGAQTASVTLPAGYGQPRVFCKSQQGDAEIEVAVANNSWPVKILPNQFAYCDVINTHAAGSASVINDANVCDEDAVNGDLSHANLAQNCTTFNGATITAYVNGQQFASGTTANSVVAFNGLPAGAVHLEGSPADITAIDLVVYCNISGVGNDQAVQQASYGVFDLNLTDGETVNCSWFFITTTGPVAGAQANGGTGPAAPNGNGVIVTNCLPPDDGNASDATPISDDASSQIVSSEQSAGSDTAL